MKVAADTAPLLAALDRNDPAHELAAEFVGGLGPDLIVPEPVIVECDHLIRARVGVSYARVFLDALIHGEHTVAFLTPALLRRAVEFDAHYAGVNLGFADGAVMAYAERHRLPILTFAFAHFRATRPARGYWKLVVDEARYRDAVG